MGILMSLLRKVGHFFLAIVRVLRKALCCKRLRSEQELLLPLTVHRTTNNSEEVLEFQDWNAWNEARPILQSNAAPMSSNMLNTFSENKNKSDDDFFKDMVPQLKKPIKMIVKEQNDEQSRVVHSNRLSMDPNCFIASVMGPDLGLIEPGNSNWEEIDSNEWDPDGLIREKRLADRELRIAEHQRRKLEKESRRSEKQTSLSSVLLTTDSREKTKSS